MNFTKDDIIAALKTVYDPEIPVNIWDLGLIYDVECAECSVQSADNDENINPGNLGSKAEATQAVGGKADTTAAHFVTIKMTLTSPMCPMAEEIVQMTKQAAESVAGPGTATVELVWDPPWSLDRLSPAARLELDLTEEGW